MYGLCTVLLALHFIFRYILICRSSYMFLFTNKCYIVMWALVSLSWGAAYFIITYFLFAPTERFYDYAQESVLAQLSNDLRSMTFFCVFVYEVRDGITYVYLDSLIGLSVIVAMMVATFAVMIICGFKIAKTLSRLPLSAKTRDIQNQLLRALIWQAVIPFIFSYMPRFLMFFFVLMGYPSNR
ncbi:hypothetical protein ANCCAN_04722 [Ancylostoma caninum]|uniref:G-protein coupled receptors family 1 profile domain-containing protein n=1 Tax=Ancylostoma caninum TaxID=29170 RepID=A0A368H0L5_ANCCA|nr:hypothetical protein ANCCAN_04722 [Ancylostoma caninum]